MRASEKEQELVIDQAPTVVQPDTEKTYLLRRKTVSKEQTCINPDILCAAAAYLGLGALATISAVNAASPQVIALTSCVASVAYMGGLQSACHVGDKERQKPYSHHSPATFKLPIKHADNTMVCHPCEAGLGTLSLGPFGIGLYLATQVSSANAPLVYCIPAAIFVCGGSLGVGKGLGLGCSTVSDSEDAVITAAPSM